LNVAILQRRKVCVDAIDQPVSKLTTFFGGEVKSHWVLASYRTAAQID
jgi:hypothetical protein